MDLVAWSPGIGRKPGRAVWEAVSVLPDIAADERASSMSIYQSSRQVMGCVHGTDDGGVPVPGRYVLRVLPPCRQTEPAVQLPCGGVDPDIGRAGMEVVGDIAVVADDAHCSYRPAELGQSVKAERYHSDCQKDDDIHVVL